MNEFIAAPIPVRAANATFEGFPLPGYNPALWTAVPSGSTVDNYLDQTRSQLPLPPSQLEETALGDQGSHAYDNFPSHRARTNELAPVGHNVVDPQQYIPDAANAAQAAQGYTHLMYGHYVPGFVRRSLVFI